jgi:hypothetical protein
VSLVDLGFAEGEGYKLERGIKEHKISTVLLTGGAERLAPVQLRQGILSLGPGFSPRGVEARGERVAVCCK